MNEVKQKPRSAYRHRLENTHKAGVLNPGLNLKHGEKAFLLPLLAPLGTVFDPPINPRQFKSDVVPSFLRLVPLVPQNLLVFGSEFLTQ
jgi:hypothetical protein